MKTTSVDMFQEYSISIVSENLCRGDLASVIVKRAYESNSFIYDNIYQVEDGRSNDREELNTIYSPDHTLLSSNFSVVPYCWRKEF
jgi:hypothetical protein